MDRRTTTRAARALIVVAGGLASVASCQDLRGMIGEGPTGTPTPPGGQPPGGAPPSGPLMPGEPLPGFGMGPPPTMGPLPPDDAAAIGPSGLRRLSRVEYDNVIFDLLGDGSRAGFGKLPEDSADPFDNDYLGQLASGTLIESVETLAEQAAARALADPMRRATLVGCTPSGPGDAACLRTFITNFGRRALRRPLTSDEIQRYLALQSFAVEDKNFFTGVELVLRAMLQDPEFLYQVELGQPVAGKPGLFKLTDHELASRLSFFLLGSAPPVALLDRAQAGKLAAPADRRAAAVELMANPRFAARMKWFHALWLGYHQLPFGGELATALRAETDALVAKVALAPKQDYLGLFRAPETFLNAALAQHYGLPAPANAAGAWVPYPDGGRRGILGHGTVLSVGSKFSDTSPTLRGIFVRSRLMCEDVPPPPPNADVDQPPKNDGGSRCKVDRYAMHASGGCASCHGRLDPVGFGLEAYDSTGRFRATDKDAPECAIKGDGDIIGFPGTGKFNGPAQLGELLIGAGALERCTVRQIYRFAMARREAAADGPTLERLSQLFARGGRAFDELLLELTSSAAFAHKRTED